MTSSLSQLFPSELFPAIFNCVDSVIPIYHQRFRTIEKVLAPSLKITDVNDFVANHKQIAECLVSANFAELTKRNWLDLIIRILHFFQDKFEALEYLAALETYEGYKYAFEKNYQNKPRSTDLTEDKIYEALQIFPSDSFESVFIRMLLEVPVRDDLQLFLGDFDNFQKLDKNKNYFLPCPDELVVKVLIQKSKNVGWLKSQKPRLYTLSKTLTRDFLSYLRKLHYPTKIWQKKMYRVVGQILTKLNLKESGKAINLLRRAIANSAKEKHMQAEIAYKALHTPLTSLLYASNL